MLVDRKPAEYGIEAIERKVQELTALAVRALAGDDSGRIEVNGRTTSRPGYAISQRLRKLVEEIFGWMKTTGGFRRTRFKGLERTQHGGYLTGAAYNLIRIAKLVGAPA